MNIRRTLVISFVLVLLALTAGLSHAREIFQSDECLIGADDVHTGDIFVLCRTLTIDGRIEGNLIGLAMDVIINGEITGNVYMAAGQMDVYGRIGGSLHFGGVVLILHSPATPASRTLPTLRGDLFSATLSTRLMENTLLSGTIVSVGYQLLLEGTVLQEINFWGSALTISGQVDSDVFASVGDPQADSSQLGTLLLPLPFDLEVVNPGLNLTEQGKISGRLDYTGVAPAAITGSVDTSNITYTPISAVPVLPLEEPGALSQYIGQLLREFWTLLLIGLLLLLFAPRWIQAPIPNLRLRPFSSFSAGMLAFILSFPVLLIVIVISIFILIILAILRLDVLVIAAMVFFAVVDFGGMAVFYFVAIFVARVVICLAVGRWILGLFWGENLRRPSAYLSLLVGVFGLSVAGSLPAVGGVFNAIALFLGLGTILIVALESIGRLRDTGSLSWSVYPARRDSDPTGANHAVPLLDAGPPAGLDNLPEGFDFGFFKED